jgi:general secretion pathway protein G
MAVPTFFQSIQQTANKRVIVDLQVLQFAIDMYERMNERLPDSLDDLGPGPRIDHWGYSYHYTPSTSEDWGTNRRLDQHQVPLNDDYDLFSSGPDGDWRKPLMNPLSHDDIVRADDGLFIGVALDH